MTISEHTLPFIHAFAAGLACMADFIMCFDVFFARHQRRERGGGKSYGSRLYSDGWSMLRSRHGQVGQGINFSISGCRDTLSCCLSDF